MKSSVTLRIAISSFLLAALFLGCVGQQSGQNQQTTPGGKLYISNSGNSSLLIYGDAANADGNQAPTEIIQRLNVQNFILDPLAVFVDTINNRLYVANTSINQILIYNNANTITGNAVPDRVISGVATTLNTPPGLTVDTTKNILYVSNTGSNAILAFDVSDAAFTGPSCSIGVPTTTCNFAPAQTITSVYQPWGLFVDSTNDLLYVANTGQNSILVFNNASIAATLARTITFTNNTALPIPSLSKPSGLFVDTTNNLLYIANNGNNSVLIFNNASTITGEIIPDRVVDNNIFISGTSTGSNTATTLNDTTQSFIANKFIGFLVTITGGTGVGQVRTITANTATQLTVSPDWTTIPPSIPDATSTYQISGQISLSNPVGVFVDTTADVLYVSNSNNSVQVFNNASTVNRNIVPRTISGTATTLSSPSGIFVDTTNHLYAANPGDDSIIVFNNASAATGNIAPNRAISDAGTPLTAPSGISADVARDILYVANLLNSISIFEHASALKSNPPPVTQTILPASGTACGDIATSRSDLCVPRGISVDITSDPENLTTLTAAISATDLTVPVLSTTGFAAAGRIRIENENISYTGVTSNSFTGATRGADGTTAASHSSGTSANSGAGILYTANTGASSILVFNQASIATGKIPPSQTIKPASGTACGDSGTTKMDLCAPLGVFVDTANDRLYVANTIASSILVFNNASSITTGNISPSQTIKPASGTACGDSATTKMDLCTPFGVFVDTVNNRLYVANTNANSILVFDNASSITTGNVPPSRTILPASGTACGDSATTMKDLCSPGSVFVDVVNDQLYVANTNANSILVFDNAGTVNGTAAPSRVIAKGTDPNNYTTLNSPSVIFVDTTR